MSFLKVYVTLRVILERKVINQVAFFNKQLNVKMNHEFFAGALIYYKLNAHGATQWWPCILLSFKNKFKAKNSKSEQGNGYFLSVNPDMNGFYYINDTSFIKMLKENVAFILK